MRQGVPFNGKPGDTTPPAVTLSSAADPVVYAAFSVTATFTEDVFGFVVGDITVTNGAASNFAVVSASVYTFTITPAANGTVAIDIPAGVCVDSAGNPNTAATQYTRTYVGANFLSWWDLDEASGASSAVDQISAYNGTPTNVTFGAVTAPDGDSAPTFNGTSSTIAISSAAFKTAFNRTECTIDFYAKVDGVQWTNGSVRILFGFAKDANNRIYLEKTSTNNQLVLKRVGAGTLSQIPHTISSTDWIHVYCTVSESADAMKLYINNVLVNTATGLGADTGGVLSASSNLGSYGAFNYHAGSLSGFKVWTTVLGDAERQALAAFPL